MEKIIVSQEIADALVELMEMCRNDRGNAADEFFAMRFHWKENGDETLAVLEDFSSDSFIRALYYGYEIEK